MDLRGKSATMRNIEGDIHSIKVYHTDAYKLAVQQGFEGTLNEWLASLKGAPGDPGKSAYQYAVDAGYKGTEEEFTQKLEADEVLEVEYGVTPIEDIVDAHNAGKAIVCKHGALLLPLVQSFGLNATFSGIDDLGYLHVIINKNDVWSHTSDSYVKAVEVRNVDHDDTIPSVRAVYQAISRAEERINDLIEEKGYLNDEQVIDLIEENAPKGITEEEVNGLIDGKKELFVAHVNTTTLDEIMAAYNAGKMCVAVEYERGGCYQLAQAATEYWPYECWFIGLQESGDVIDVVRVLKHRDTGITEWDHIPYPMYTMDTLESLVTTFIEERPSDWNANEGEAGYIQNRPFYDEMGETMETREDFYFINDAEFNALLYEKRAEATYIVDGKKCVYDGQDHEDDSRWGFYVSDGAASYHALVTKSTNQLNLIGNDGLGHLSTITIPVEVMVPHKLDTKYLPMDEIMGGISGAKPMVYFELDVERISSTDIRFTNVEQIKTAIDNGMTIVIKATEFASGVIHTRERRFIMKKDAMYLATPSGIAYYYTQPVGASGTPLAMKLDQDAFANGDEIIQDVTWQINNMSLLGAYAVSV